MSRFTTSVVSPGAAPETAIATRSRKLATSTITPVSLCYEQTVTCGQYRNVALEAAEIARMVARNPQFRASETRTLSDDRSARMWNKTRLLYGHYCSKLTGALRTCFLDGDAAFLALLGVAMAFYSFLVDDCIAKLADTRMLLYRLAAVSGLGLQYVVWVGFTLVLVLISTGLCQWIAPQAIGSGLPEMKTILRGVVLKEYLTFRTLIIKGIALTLCLGGGVPIGKEGPFVHISSIMATLLIKLLSVFRTNYNNESRNIEMLAAACAVGVACTFGSPIGGILFSIEVTSVYFAVRNYWRGFFAATWAAIVFRMCTVWFKYENTLIAFTQTTFSTTNPFEPLELLAYSFVGLFCGVTGPIFVLLHKKIVLFVRNNRHIKKVVSLNRLIYPAFGVLIIMSVTFPAGSGQFVVSSVSPKTAIRDLFSNFSWFDANGTAYKMNIVQRWTPSNVSFFVTLTVYAIATFFTSILANTLPIPTGVFIPTFVTGAAFGRIFGELLCFFFPNGLPSGDEDGRVVPGSYAVVAAAFTGSVTHTLSTSVIVFELTGQIVYMIPVMIAVIIANTIAAYIHPSIFDSIIKVKNLPYLPSMLPTASKVHNILVEDIMIRNPKFISMDTTLGQAYEILQALPSVKAFPFVDSDSSKILLGSIPRLQLIAEVEHRIGDEARKAEAKRRREIDDDARLVEAILTANETRFSQQLDDLEAKLSKRDISPSSENNYLILGAPRRHHSTPALSPVQESAVIHTLENGYTVSEANPAAAMIQGRGSQGTLAAVSAEFKKLTGFIRPIRNHVKTAASVDFDMTDEERLEWENEQLRAPLDCQHLHIDNAPFQLMECTSLHKAHSLFSLLSLSRAYVTRLGRLVGVVSLRDIRQALETRTTQQGFAQEHKDEHLSLNTDREAVAQEGLIDVALRPIRQCITIPEVYVTDEENRTRAISHF